MTVKRHVNVCGVDCHPYNDQCNGYCYGKTLTPMEHETHFIRTNDYIVIKREDIRKMFTIWQREQLQTLEDIAEQYRERNNLPSLRDSAIIEPSHPAHDKGWDMIEHHSRMEAIRKNRTR